MAKVTSQPAAVQPIPVPQQRFSHIHVDIVGPLPISKEGFRYLFTIINRSSRMLEAVPLTIIETETCRDTLISQWVARFGVPAHLTSDRGAQFTSELWASVIGMHHNTTTAYHLQSNGMVERAHRRLKDALKARRLAPAPALGPPGHQQRPQRGHRQVGGTDGVQHLSHPSSTVGG